MAKKSSRPQGRSRYTVTSQPKRATPLDPRLEAIASARHEDGPVDRALVHETADGRLMVDVVAELKDAGVSVPGLNVVASAKGIVTGTVEIDQIEVVAAHENVLRLQAAERVYPDLHDSIAEVHARPADLQAALPAGTPVPDGSGVIVGIVDFGCDFLHQNFRRPDGTTRLLFLWDQNGAPGPQTPAPQPYGYGRELTEAFLNEALDRATAPPPAAQNPFHPDDFENGAYRHAGYRPSFPVALGDSPAHGTHVMDIAAGNGRGTGFPGVAPRADLIFVELGGGDVDPAEESFGNSVRLIEAVDYIFRKADELGRPAVVNLSLGTHGGPHDGSTPAERFFDALLEEPNRAIVLSAGNSHRRRIHAGGSVSADSPRDLRWQIRSTVATDNEVEVWYPGDAEMEVLLVDPDGEAIGPVPLGAPTLQVSIRGHKVAVINHRRDPVNGDNQIGVYLFRKPAALSNSEALPAGEWQVRLRAAGEPIAFHAWIERVSPQAQAQFSQQDDDPSHTLGSISCGRSTLAVGAYNARASDRPLASFTSEGPTRDGRRKPEISAPGGEISDGVVAARSLTHTRRTPMPGTSMAAPHVTGLIALLMQASPASLTVADVRELVISAARRDPPGGELWHPRYGFGRIDVREAVRLLPSGVTPLLPVPEPAASVAGNGEPALLGPGNDLLGKLLAMTADHGLHVRLQIEIEPK